MELENISNDELIFRIQKLVRTERKVMHLVLLHIAEIETRKLYAELGFDSMYTYLTQGLGYSESSAYRRLKSARLLKQIPEVSEKIEDGSLNLSQLTQVQKCLNYKKQNGEKLSRETTLDVLNKIENKNSFETQKTLTVELNLPVEVRQTIKPQKDDSVRIELTLTKKQFSELEQAKSLLSHICPNGNFAEIIYELAKRFNDKKLQGKSIFDSVEISENIEMTRNVEVPLNNEMTASNNSNSNKDCDNKNTLTKKSLVACKKIDLMTQSLFKAAADSGHKINPKSENCKKIKRGYISVKTKRMLLKKAYNCCEYRNPRTQQKCQSKYKLEIEHIRPVALGGVNHISNLRVFCQAHNALAARQLGLVF